MRVVFSIHLGDADELTSSDSAQAGLDLGDKSLVALIRESEGGSKAEQRSGKTRRWQGHGGSEWTAWCWRWSSLYGGSRDGGDGRHAAA
jgi:hypothetical protein